jgi:hypothetical protein
MDLGTGIFLSSILISLVLLYGFTRDRWRWRKMISLALAVGLVLVTGIIAATAIVQYWDALFPTSLPRQTQYAGIKLGMSPQ